MDLLVEMQTLFARYNLFYKDQKIGFMIGYLKDNNNVSKEEFIFILRKIMLDEI